MELIVFDLDGTLLSRDSIISSLTAQTLKQLSERGIAYTVATGRMLYDSQALLSAHGFYLPMVLKNGVMVWRPRTKDYTRVNQLTQDEVSHVMETMIKKDINPFIGTLEPDNHHAIFHLEPRNSAEQRLVNNYHKNRSVSLYPLSVLPKDAVITNISSIGPIEVITQAEQLIEDEEHLVIYTGEAIEGQHLGWMDIHHSDASKGAAITRIKEDIGATKVICFGDSENDLSMFSMADECYAPDNAKAPIKAAATAVIGHHDEDGIAEFLRRRFELD